MSPTTESSLNQFCKFRIKSFQVISQLILVVFTVLFLTLHGFGQTSTQRQLVEQQLNSNTKSGVESFLSYRNLIQKVHLNLLIDSIYTVSYDIENKQDKEYEEGSFICVVLYNKQRIIGYFIDSNEALGIAGITHLNQPAFDSINLRYLKTYFTPLIIGDVFNTRILYHFGIYLGIGSNEPGEYKELKAAINKINRQLILSWMSSAIPELKLYGLVGLVVLDKRGYKLSAKELKAINTIKANKSKVSVCNGCFIDWSTVNIEANKILQGKGIVAELLKK